MMQNKLEVLLPETFYHIFNRANGSEKLFLSDENYVFFLRKFKEFISPICHTYCYCLMPNHFHFLIEVKSENELDTYFKSLDKVSITLQGFKTLEGFAKQKTISKLLSQQFSHFFNSYTQAFNKQNNRKGSLFMHPYKRKKINDTAYLLQLVKYIHYNPIDAKLCKQLNDWKFSSYSSLISDAFTNLKREALMLWFDTKENFEFVHKTEPNDTDYEIEY
jgi:putative transposase